MSTSWGQIENPLHILPPGIHIEPIASNRLAAAKARLDAQARPTGSLGRLEELACRLAAMGYQAEVEPAIMFTVAGDHGVAAEGVSCFKQEVTRQMVANFLAGGASINALTQAAGMKLYIVDAGCKGGPFAPHEQILEYRLGDGTNNIMREPAMSLETCLQGLSIGVNLAREYIQIGYRCLAIGEMGIANSTSAAALFAHLLDMPVDTAVGPGTGLRPEDIAHKADVVRLALAVNATQLAERPFLREANTDPLVRYNDPVAALTCLGGYEIVIMTGLILGAASAACPILIDGYIASSAYVAACMMYPAAGDYCILSHMSAEPAHMPAMKRLEKYLLHPEWNKPLLQLGLRLGEGTGCAAAYPLLRSACAVYKQIASFQEAGVTKGL